RRCGRSCPSAAALPGGRGSRRLGPRRECSGPYERRGRRRRLARHRGDHADRADPADTWTVDQRSGEDDHDCAGPDADGRVRTSGIFSDGSPVPAETTRAIAGECMTWTRILTDRATGTPIDAKALTYHIPASVRLPLAAKWQSCSVPGCIRRAETSEV